MALSNAEFEKLADNCEKLPKMDVLIAILDKLSEDFLFLLPYVSTGDSEELMFGKAYLEPHSDYMFNVPEDIFGEEKHSELSRILEAFQAMPENCKLKEALIDISHPEDGDEVTTFNRKNIQILHNLGYEVIISFENITAAELGTAGHFGEKPDDVTTFTNVYVTAGPFIIWLS